MKMSTLHPVSKLLQDEFAGRVYITIHPKCDRYTSMLPTTIEFPSLKFDNNLKEGLFYPWYDEHLVSRLGESVSEKFLKNAGGIGPYDKRTKQSLIDWKTNEKVPAVDATFFYLFNSEDIWEKVARWYNNNYLPEKEYVKIDDDHPYSLKSDDFNEKTSLVLDPSDLVHVGGDGKLWDPKDNFNFCFQIRIMPEIKLEKDVFGVDENKRKLELLYQNTPLSKELIKIIGEQAEEKVLIIHIECVQSECA